MRLGVALSIVASALLVPSAVSAAPGDCPFPTRIRTEAELIQLGTDSDCLDESIEQVSNITLTANPWIPIEGFVGTYDGNSKTIYGLRLDGSNAGLFNVGNAGATFRDLDIVVASSTGGDYVGALVGSADGSIAIDNVHVTGNVTGGSNVGGLVGELMSPFTTESIDISDSSIMGDVTGSGDRVGGLVGNSSGSITVDNASVAGDITSATSSRIGGIAGEVFNPFDELTLDVVDAVVTGDITGSGDYIGGLIGETNATDITITTSNITGDPSGGYRVGGLIGSALNFSDPTTIIIDDATVDGNLTGTDDYIGGLIGETNATDITITTSNITGNLSGGYRVGGLIGSAYDGSELITIVIDDTTVDGNLTGTDDYIGGLIGDTNATDITITASNVTGDLNGIYRIGGLIGNAYNGSDPTTIVIDDATINGNLTGTDDYIGGLIGDTNATDITITASNVTGDLSGGYRVGGLIGNAYDFPSLLSISIDRSAFTGNVVGSGGYVGGLIGETSAEDISITATSVIGTVESAGLFVGGMIGNSISLDSLSITESFVQGDVGGDLYIGGFLGFSLTGTVTIINSFVRGSSTGSQYVGGLIGSGLDFVELTNSYFHGMVTASVSDGGSFTGGSPGGLTIDQALCTDIACPVGDTVTVDELRSATFLADLGWDMSNTWCIRSSRNDGFPILRAFTSGALDARSCNPRPSSRTTYRVTLDPAGGTCIDGTPRTQRWAADFRGSRHVPGPTDCTRPDHTFVGWAEAETPDTVLSLPLVADPSDGVQRYLVTQDLDLVAVWSVEAEPAYIDDLRVLANFLCGPCTTAWLIYTRPPSVTQVSIGLDGTPTTCAREALVFGFTVCELVGLEPGPHTVILTPTRNGADDSPAGLSTSATFTLIG